MAQPLAGYRVADFSHVMAGPFCSHFLRLLGAEVIKVESLSGDPMRNYGPFRRWDGMAPAFVAANVGKKSIAVNLKQPDGLEVARRLVASSDVVLENFRPGVMQRLGLGYEVCRTLRQRLVYCSISGYGQSGPQRDYPAIDNIVQATSGMMAGNGDEGDPPSRVGWPAVDTYTGTLAALAVLAALHATRPVRQRAVHRCLHAGCLVGDVDFAGHAVPGDRAAAAPHRQHRLQRRADRRRVQTRDGLRLSLGVVQDNQFAALCRAIGQPHLIDGSALRDDRGARRPEHAQRVA